jgi:hypothetical protein
MTEHNLTVQQPIRILDNKLMLDVNFKSMESSVFSSQRLAILNSTIKRMLIEDIVKIYSVKSVSAAPSEVQLLTEPEKYSPDYSVYLSVEESLLVGDTWWAKIIRTISFGIYPERIRREGTVNLVVKDATQNVVYGTKSKLISNQNFAVPFLIIPINLENHPVF